MAVPPLPVVVVVSVFFVMGACHGGDSTATRLIHPSDPWPLPGHPEAMKMSCLVEAIFTPVFHRSASDHHVMKVVELGSEPASSAIFRE
jgi:hypothetical protein